MDSNAHSGLWHAPENNRRGDILENIILQNNLLVVNDSPEPTYVRTAAGNSAETHIDVTLVDSRAAGIVTQWAVDPSESCSDHRYLSFKVRDIQSHIVHRRNFRTANWLMFNNMLFTGHLPATTGETSTTSEYIDYLARSLTKETRRCLDQAAPKRRITIREARNPWWNDDLRRLRKKINMTPQHERKPLQVMYKSCIKKCKEMSWQNFCTDIESTRDLSKLFRKMQGNSTLDLGTVGPAEGDLPPDPQSSLKYLLEAHQPGTVVVDGAWSSEPPPT